MRRASTALLISRETLLAVPFTHRTDRLHFQLRALRSLRSEPLRGLI